jgi:glycosyltransferase involved in cell wall biosynthesis
MSLCVLSVAFPFAPITPDPVGGAEQVLSLLDRALVAVGARSVVLACEGSHPAGELALLPAPGPEIDAARKCEVYDEVRRRLARTIETVRPDVVHLHGADFDQYLPRFGPPVLVTLHMPLAWYAPGALQPARPLVWLAPVSRDQACRAPPGAQLCEPIENGVELDAYTPGRKHAFAVALGRICPEKGFHLALDAARSAGLALLLAGSVFPYAEHRRYFEAEIRPRLDRRRRWIGPVTGPAKRRLVAAARCVVTPSLVPETSSLVAREALASGTPVVGLRRGALPDAVEDGRTGILVEEPSGLAEALSQVGRISPEECRREAQRRFPARRTVAAYLDAYRRLARGEPLAPFSMEAAA